MSLRLDERWRSEIAGMLDERFYPMDWVEGQIASGTIGLLQNESAIIGVTRREYPGGASELHGMFAAGDKESIKELVKDALAAAKAAGCIVAAIESRIGWEREFRELGFTRDKVRIVKELG